MFRRVNGQRGEVGGEREEMGEEWVRYDIVQLREVEGANIVTVGLDNARRVRRRVRSMESRDGIGCGSGLVGRQGRVARKRGRGERPRRFGQQRSASVLLLPHPIQIHMGVTVAVVVVFLNNAFFESTGEFHATCTQLCGPRKRTMAIDLTLHLRQWS